MAKKKGGFMELTIFIVGYLGVIHEERTDGDLLVKVDLRGGGILICLSHMESAGRDGDHTVRNCHHPPLTITNTNKFSLISTFFSPNAKQLAASN